MPHIGILIQEYKMGIDKLLLSDYCLFQHTAFIRNFRQEPAITTGDEAFKIQKFAYRLFPALMQLSGKLASEILLDGQACRSFYTAALKTIDPACIPPQEIALMRILVVELPEHMSLAVITAEDNQLVARLSGGRVLKCSHPKEMADLLLAAGVYACDVRVPDWRAGNLSPEIGQKISIFGLLSKAEL